MDIKVYAVLKDYFDTDLKLKADDMESLKKELLILNPSAKEILNLSRFAVNDVFISHEHQFSDHETVSVIPPSSGG